MARKKILFGVGAGIVSLGIDGISSLLILRLLTQYLSVDKAGYWILVTSAGSLLLVLQCGLGPAIARAVATARVANDTDKLRSLLGAVDVAFRFVAGAVAVAAVAIFFCYLWSTAQRAHLTLASAMGWFPYAVGMAANLQGQASIFILNGYGEVGWDKVFRSVFTVLGFVAVWGALMMGASLPTLGLIYLGQNLLFWIAAHWKLRGYLDESARRLPPQAGQVGTLFREGSKLLLLSVLTYLITQFTIFIVEKYFGLTQVAAYSAMLRVGVLIGTVGSLLPQMLYPYTASSWAAGDYARCRRYYVAGLLISVAITLLMVLPLCLFGREIFALWLGAKVPYSAACFAAVLVFYVVYVHHSAHATPALAVEGDAFTIPAIINTAMVMILVFELPRFLGLVGVPLGMVLGTAPVSAYVVWKSWRMIMMPSPIVAPADFGTQL